MRALWRFVWLFPLFSALTACGIAEDRSGCFVPRYVTIHAQPDTKDVKYFVFDASGGFIGSHVLIRPDTVSNESSWDITDAISITGGQLTIITWGNGKDFPDPYVGAGAGNTYYSLPIIENYPHIAESPGDLFYGNTTVASDDADTIHVYMNRAVAGVRITAYGLQSYTGATDTDFSFVIGKTYGSVTYLARFFGDLVSYRPAVAKGTGDLFATPLFYTFPSDVEGSPTEVSVDVYRAGELIYTVNLDQNGQPIRLLRDKILDLTIRLVDGVLTVNLIVVPWDYKFIDQLFTSD